MAELKRNMIELIKNPEEVNKGGEPEIERYWTKSFIPFRVVMEAFELDEELKNGKLKESEKLLKMANFVAEEAYGGAFTAEYLLDHLHAPNGAEELQKQIAFIATGGQTEETKKFLREKKS